MVKRWQPFLVGALTFVFAVSLRNDFLYFLFGLECMVYAAAVFQVFWLAGRVKMEIRIPRNRIYRGKPFEIWVELQNSGLMPVPQLLVRAAVRVFPEKSELLMKGRTMLDSQERGYMCFSMDSSHCGCLDIRADQLVVTDFLGMVQRRVYAKQQETVSVFVLPEILESSLEPPEAETDVLSYDGEAGRRGNAGQDVSEIRAYRQGDPIKLIHWKISARLQELMVRELSDNVQKLPWVFVDLQQQEKDSTGTRNPETWDRLAQTVALVSRALLEGETGHLVLWINALERRVQRFEVTDLESMEEMLCALLRSVSFQTGEFGQLLREIFTNEAKGTCIQIDIQGNITSSEAQG